MLDKNLESILDQWRTPPTDLPAEVPYKSQLVFMPINVLLGMLGYNYREHSLRTVDNISDSISQVGLLEPHVITYNTQTKDWRFGDGEGRLWSCYQVGADEVPVEIFYDVPSNVALRMQVALNSTKTKIAPEDIAKYTGKLSNNITEHNYETAGRKGRFEDYRPSIKELAHVLSRSTTTVKNYFIFNEGLHAELKDYVLMHREKNMFSRSVKIGRSLPNKNHQRRFLSVLRQEEEVFAKEELQRKKDAVNNGKEYIRKPSRLLDRHFNTLLKDFVELVKEPDDGQLHMRRYKTHYRDGDATLRELHNMTRTTKSYIDAYTNLIEVYPEIKRDSLERIVTHVNLLKNTYDNLISLLPEDIQKSVTTYLRKPPEKSFREKVLEQAELRRKKTDDGTIKRIKTIGDKIVYVPVEKIEMDLDQIRSEYKKESIDALVKEIKAYGQIKPGLIKRLDEPKGEIEFKFVYGQSRYKAVLLAGKKYYKAFIRDDLTQADISLLQSVEDLSESDTPLDRAKVLNKKYNLKQLQAQEENIPYTKKDFTREFKHLGDSKTLRDALEFMELDEHIRNMVSMRVIGYETALKIGKLSEENRLNVLYKVMTSQIKGQDLEKYMTAVQENSNHQKLFPVVEKSYVKILEQFEKESMRPFNYMCSHLASKNGISHRLVTSEVVMPFVKIYQSILRLERNLARNGNGVVVH